MRTSSIRQGEAEATYPSRRVDVPAHERRLARGTVNLKSSRFVLWCWFAPRAPTFNERLSLKDGSTRTAQAVGMNESNGQAQPTVDAGLDAESEPFSLVESATQEYQLPPRSLAEYSCLGNGSEKNQYSELSRCCRRHGTVSLAREKSLRLSIDTEPALFTGAQIAQSMSGSRTHSRSTGATNSLCQGDLSHPDCQRGRVSARLFTTQKDAEVNSTSIQPIKTSWRRSFLAHPRERLNGCLTRPLRAKNVDRNWHETRFAAVFATESPRFASIGTGISHADLPNDLANALGEWKKNQTKNNCIPIDPNYLSARVRKVLDRPFRFVELAEDINSSMPAYVVSRVQDLLNTRKKSLCGSQVLLLGVTYKSGIADTRESPAARVANFLLAKGAEISFYDPIVTSWAPNQKLELLRVPALTESLASSDATILLQHLPDTDIDDLANASQIFLDTRGVTRTPAAVRH